MEQETTKEKILLTALDLFSQKGYDSVGIQEICGESGITKPTLYYYYKSKLGLLEAMLSLFGGNMVSVLKKASAYDHDMIKHLTEVLISSVEFARENPKFFRLYHSLDYAGRENDTYKAHLRLKEQVDNIYLTLFEKCTEEFGNMKGYEKLFSKNFQSLVVSTAIAVLNEELAFTDDDVYRIIRAFVYGVAN